MFDIFSVIKQLKRNITKTDIAFFAVLVVVYFLTRIINLDALPIFGDEGIYVRWAKVAWHDASWRFISLTDGKQPLQTWGTIPFLKLFPLEPFFAGRLFAVFTGFFALIGFIATGFYLWGKRTGYVLGVLYIFTPYFLFYDRMALVDSAVNGFAVWMFLFSIILARTRRLDVSLIYGALSGMALLAKSSVRLFIGLGYLASIFIFKDKLKNSKGELIKNIINFSLLYALSSLIAIAMYNVQRLSPFFHYVAQKNKTFILTGEEFLKQPFAFFWSNAKIVTLYVFSELGVVVGIVGLIGLFLLFKKDKRLAIYFSMWILLPFIIVSLVSKVIFPRYLIFLGSFLTLLAGYFLTQVKQRTALFVSVVLIVVSVGYFDYTILFDQKNIPFPQVDRGQYIEGATAGWGIKDIIAYSRQKAKTKKVILLAEGDFGVIGDQLDANLRLDDHIFIKGLWPLKKEDIVENQANLDENFVYVVFSHQEKLPKGWPIKLIKHYPKPGGKAHIFFAEVVR